MSTSELPAACQRVVAAAAERGVVVTVATFPEGTRTAQEAADAIGCRVDAIAKSIVLASSGGGVLVLTSGSKRVDYDKVAALAGLSDVGRATPGQAREWTSFVIGGTAPFGHPRPLTILADETLCVHETVWASAGTPTTVFAIAPDQLLAATGAVVGDVIAG